MSCMGERIPKLTERIGDYCEINLLLLTLTIVTSSIRALSFVRDSVELIRGALECGKECHHILSAHNRKGFRIGAVIVKLVIT